MSSFTVASTTVTFDAIEPFQGNGGPLEEWTVDVLLANSTDWGALFSMRSWLVSQRPIPGGNNVYVDIGGGAGQGYLQVDNRDPHQAVLTALREKAQEPGSFRRLATATFVITG